MQNSDLVADFSSATNVLNELELQRLNQAIRGLSRQQLAWAGGFVAGLSQEPLTEVAVESTQVTILYASQSGNAESVARFLSEQVHQFGLPSRLIAADEYRPRDLAKERFLILVSSTQGEGEPPENALDLYRFLHAKRAPKLDQLQYAVFGLGDSSYEHFCQAARDFDQRLNELGAKRLQERVEADIDFDSVAQEWLPKTVALLKQELPSRQADVVSIAIRPVVVERVDVNHPYRAELLEKRRITMENALSDVQHLSLAIDPERLQYQPGDALGVLHRNEPELVEQILHLTGAVGQSGVELKGSEVSLQEALIGKLEITRLHPTVVKRWAELSDSNVLQSLVADREVLLRYTANHQLIDLMLEFPLEFDAETLSKTLLPVQSRLYSIASSQESLDDEVHLTVATQRHQTGSRHYLGSASGFLNGRLNEGDEAEVYVAKNAGFRLPQSGDTPILMIGAGTGIAPYRAFMQHREALGQRGSNWLLFGNRHFKRDFLYQADWLAWRKSGLLQRVSSIFSRDVVGRGYVQDRLLQESAEVYRQIEEGANLYVCGATNMESAVRQTLSDIVQQEGGLSAEKSLEFIENLRSQGRYQRDVY